MGAYMVVDLAGTQNLLGCSDHLQHISRISYVSINPIMQIKMKPGITRLKNLKFQLALSFTSSKEI
jgi:hypothetical protein